MAKYEIKIPAGFDTRSQKQVGLFAAQLDDQLKRLKNNTKGLTVKQLEWQQKPGMNTIGMLLAHLALVEVWWINIAPTGIPWDTDGKKIIKRVCGFEDDGLPLPAKGRHSKYLKGYSLKRYISVLDKARRSIKHEMKSWKDKDIGKPYELGKKQFSRSWTLYHVLEHFAAHFGQILMLKHMMRDAGVLNEKKK